MNTEYIQRSLSTNAPDTDASDIQTVRSVRAVQAGHKAFPKALKVDSFPHRDAPGVGGIPATIANLEHMLSQADILVRYNVIKKKLEIAIPDDDGVEDNRDNASMSQIKSLAAMNGLATGLVPEYIEAIANSNPHNPVENWIRSRPWDGEDRLAAFCNTVIAKDGFPVPFKNILIRKWLISAVAAALMRNGFKARGVLTLQGPQGIGKTSWGMALISDEQLRRSVLKVDHHMDGSKDSILGAISHWIVEIGELDGAFKKDIARLKGILTSDSDKVRKPYARAESEYPRRTVFFATVNDDNFLVDPTGNSRWWTIPVIRLDFGHSIDMQQVYAQLAQEFEGGAQWWLTPDEEAELEEHNSSHRAVSSIRERVMEFLDLERRGLSTNPKMTASGLLQSIGIREPTNQQSRECGAVLRELLSDPKKSGGVMKWSIPFRSDVSLVLGQGALSPEDDEDRF